MSGPEPPDLKVMGGYAHLFPLAKQAEDIQPGAGAMVQELLGCAWGRKLWTDDDQEPCAEQAKAIVVMHNPDEPGTTLGLKLCAKHNDFVMGATDQHKGTPEAPACPHCGSPAMDRGATGLDLCNDCGGLSRDGKVLKPVGNNGS
jgi:hypothetical protein